MGLLFSSLFSKLFSSQDVRVLILGLDNAGKTTILFKLYAPNRVIRTMPTIGFNVETVVYKNLNFNVWDLGGQTNIRPYWRCYYEKTNAIIFVVDSCDRERIDVAKKELMAMMDEDELKSAVLLVFANKQDCKGAMSESEVSSSLGLTTIKDRQWHLQKSAATKGEGLQEGLEWLANAISGQSSQQSGGGGGGGGGGWMSSWFSSSSPTSSSSSSSSLPSSSSTSFSTSSSPTASSSLSSSSSALQK